MDIAIIGAGNVGTGLGRRLAAQGHRIFVSFSRTPEGLTNAADVIGGGALALSPEVAAAGAHLTILATPWAATLDIVRRIAPVLVGRIVWDCTNPFLPSMDELMIGTSTSAGEEVAKAAPGAKVVKAIPPFAELLHSASLMLRDRAPSVFVCGDDPEARAAVAALVNAVGADAVEAGPLKLARFTEPAGMLIANLAYVQSKGARIGLALLRE